MTDTWQTDPTEPRERKPVERPEDPIEPRPRPFTVERPKVDVGEDVLRTLGPAAVRGAAGVAGLPAFLRDLTEHGAKYVSDKLGLDEETSRKVEQAYRIYQRINERVSPAARLQAAAPTSQQITGAIERFTGPLYKPQTVPGEFANTAVEFGVGALAGPVPRAATLAGQLGNFLSSVTRWGIIPGLASEAGGQAARKYAPDWETAARIGTGFAGAAVQPAITGTVRAVAGGSTTRMRQLLRDRLPDDVTPQHIDAAEQLINDALRMSPPIQLSWADAIAQTTGRPMLANVVRTLEGAPSSAPRMEQFYGQRMPAIEQGAQRQFEAIAPPPPPQDPYRIGPTAQQTAEGIVNAERQAINAETEQLYRVSAGTRLTPHAYAELQLIPGYREARDAIRNDPQRTRYIADLPDDSVGFVNAVKKYLGEQAESATAPLQQQRSVEQAAGYTAGERTARRIGIEADPRYQTALHEQEQLRAQRLEPLLQGPLGRLAATNKTTQQAIEVLFPRQPLPHSEAQIADAVSRLAAENPVVARQLVRAHLESAFQQAARATTAGGEQPMTGAKFFVDVAGTPQQRANMQAAVRALPNGDQLWTGLERFMDVMQATGRGRVGTHTAFSAEELRALGASNVLAETAKTGMTPFGGFRFLADRWQRWALGQNLDELARIITEPGSGNLLRAIAASPPRSQRAQNAMNRLGLLLVNMTAERGAEGGPP